MCVCVLQFACLSSSSVVIGGKLWINCSIIWGKNVVVAIGAGVARANFVLTSLLTSLEYTNLQAAFLILFFSFAARAKRSDQVVIIDVRCRCGFMRECVFNYCDI